MKKNKITQILLLIISLILIPSQSVFATSETINLNQNLYAITSDNISIEGMEWNEGSQTLPFSQNNAENSGQDYDPNGNVVFLPFITAGSGTSNVPAPNGPTPNYYVSPTGNDNNVGSLSLPWKTLKKASETAVAGDTVKILPGTYYEKLAPRNSGTADAYITFTADAGTVILDGSGVSMSSDYKGDGLVQILGNSYIRVQNLTAQNSSVNCVNISDNSSGTRPKHIEIRSMKLENCNKVGIRARNSEDLLLKDNQINHVTYSSGIGVWWSTRVIVDHNTITNAHYYHECQGAYDEALTISGTTHFEVMYNTLDNTEANPAGFCSNAEKLGIDIKQSSENGVVHHNTVRKMNAGGIYVDGWDAGANGTPTLNHIDIYSNYVSDGGGIVVGCERSDGVVEYINIYNNVVVNAWFAGIQVRGAWGDGLRKNITIYNNTIYGASLAGGNGGAGIYVTTANLGSNNGDAPVIIRNNISMFYFLSSGGGTVGQIRAGNATMASKISADHNLVNGPQSCSTQYPACVELGSRESDTAAHVFANAGAFDLRLSHASSAIDKGMTIEMVATDYEDVLRPSGAAYDIGAFEHR